jgi:hypothetical protein
MKLGPVGAKHNVDFPAFEALAKRLSASFDACMAALSAHNHSAVEFWLRCKPALMKFSALAKSMYDPQLRIWLDYFPPSAFCIISSTYLQSQQTATLTRITSFLGLPPHDWEKLSLGEHSLAKQHQVSVSNSTLASLGEFYNRYGQRAFDYVESHDYWGCGDATADPAQLS